LLLTGVSLAVAIVPEGLPAVLTFTLALGAQRMLKRKALIRKLPAVETLGSVTVICSDKTGTLTQNRMTVTRLETASSILDLPSTATGGGGLELPSADPAAALVLSGASLCNDAQLAAGDGDQGIGDPTETALLVAAARLGLRKPTLDAALPRAAELPFDSDRKRMTTIHRLDGGELPQVLQPLARLADGAALAAFTKGAADGMVGSCDRIWTAGGLEALSPAWREKIAAATERMAADGMRVLGVALRYWPSLPTADESSAIERDLIFLGLVAMIDPPRAEAKAAVATCKAAGIRPIMITGDHPVTARYIAAELGMASHDGPVVTGRELEQLDADSLAAAVRCSNVFARVSPEHKLRIVEALQQQGHVVAMTGDGVNDAPALKKADIGVAMGSGTDVAKEAADMVLLDDNFATIVAAVEEGRVVYDNVRRFVAFSIAGNIGKVLTVAVPPFFGLPLLLMPIQILFSNLLTDGLLGLGLGFEKAERNTMRRPPYSPAAGVLSGGMSWHVGLLGALIGVLMIGLGYLTWAALTADGDLSSDEAVYLSTVVFTTLALLQLGRVMSTRSFTDPLFRLSLFANPLLLAMILLALGLQMIAVYLPSAQPFFLTVGLPASDLAIGVAIAAAVLAIMEMEKAWRAQGARPATRREAWDTSPS
jgi:Ca2+-transporting ATPase